MKPREIVLVIFLILVGIGIYAARKGKFHADWNTGDFFFTTADEFLFEETLDIEPPYPAGFMIANRHGNVDIRGTDQEKITCTFQKRIWRRHKEDAVKVADKLKASVVRDGDRIRISTNRQDFKKTNFATSFNVLVPRRLIVEVSNTHGEVRISGTAEASIGNTHGPVFVNDIAGRLTVKNTHDNVEADSVGSDAAIETTHGRVTATRIKGKAILNTTHGRIRAEDIEGPLQAAAAHSRVEGSRIAGPVDILNSFEKITLDTVNLVKISGHHSDVFIAEARGDVGINDDNARIELTSVQGNVSIDGKGLSVTGRQWRGGLIDIRSSQENVDLADFQASTKIAVSHGRIVLSPADLSLPLTVDATYSDIVFTWPRGAVNPLEARTRNGNIDWGLGTGPDFEEKNGDTVMKGFSKEVQRPKVNLFTTYADIRLREDSEH